MSAHKAGSSCDCDLHDLASFLALWRYKSCVGQTALRKSPTAPAISSGSSLEKMRFPSLRSETRSAAFKMERWREIDGPEMEKRAAISPAARSRSFNS